MFLYPPFYRKLKRGPQVILPKDIALIIEFSSIDKNSICVDAGTGSGWLALSLARICKFVYSYDKRPDFINIAMKNKEILNIDNIEFKNKDITKGIDERNVDLVALDMPNPELVIKHAKRALRDNGCLVAYLPNIEQVKKFVLKLEKSKFKEIYTVENIVRDLLIRKEGSRPTNKGLWHTGYLTFAYK